MGSTCGTGSGKLARLGGASLGGPSLSGLRTPGSVGRVTGDDARGPLGDGPDAHPAISMTTSTVGKAAAEAQDDGGKSNARRDMDGTLTDPRRGVHTVSP